jgi:hypothetical protein
LPNRHSYAALAFPLALRSAARAARLEGRGAAAIALARALA